ncbi:MAG: ACT domain-containing protein [Atopobiaceae bacterium]|jgi:ACT domain-containing protein|nr:ACT domain-containing protein [Olegusella sp.]
MADSKKSLAGRVVITVLGSDRSGIVAAVTSAIAERDANILDISQTILQGIFTMTMLVDLKDLETDFPALQKQLSGLGTHLGVQIQMQREEVFKYMYRL